MIFERSLKLDQDWKWQ